MMVVVVWPKTWPRCVIQTGGLAQLNSQTGDASEAAIESWSWDCRSPPELPPTSSPKSLGKYSGGNTDNTGFNWQLFHPHELSWKERNLRKAIPGGGSVMRSEASPSSSSCSADCCHFNTLFTMGQIDINWKTPSRINTLCLGHCGGKFLMENFGWKILVQKAKSNILKHPALSFKYYRHWVFEVRFFLTRCNIWNSWDPCFPKI